MNHHYIQLGYQLAASTANGAWSFVVTSIILYAMDKVPFLRLRLHEDEELLGVDLAEIGEFAYYDSDNESALGMKNSAYIAEPIRSNDPRVAQLKAAASKQQEQVDGTHKDGEKFTPEDSSENQSTKH